MVSAPDKQPIPGVTVSEKGTSNRVMTKPDGTFSINVTSASSTLTMSYTGYKSTDILVSAIKSDVDILLTED